MKPKRISKMIDQNTKIYISCSQSPGTFGSNVFNKLFQLKSINAIYIPRKFQDEKSVIRAIKAFDVAGSAISSPFKYSIINRLDFLDPKAKKINSVNTIKKTNQKLIGYNTDWIGAQLAIKSKIQALKMRPKSARIIGTGGVVPSIILALQNLKIENITICYRNESAAKKLKKKWGIELEELSKTYSAPSDILINAVPEIDQKLEQYFLSKIPQSKILFDIRVSTRKSNLIRIAEKRKIEFIQGYEMAAYQLIEQFYIYFNQRLLPKEVFAIINSEYLVSR
jgi:shikimate dehydrogenase